jgi:DNA-binding GntR family transcriptional regulator
VARKSKTAKPRRSGNQSEHAYQELKAGILAGDLKSGTRLVEAQLAEDLNVSRTPVREALRRLVAERIVSRNQDGSLIVHQATSREIEELYLIREVLDGLAARLAAYRVSERDVAVAEYTIESLAGKGGDAATDAIGANIQFHDILYEAARNERLQQMGADLRDFVRLFSREPLAETKRNEEIADEHRAILEALRKGDPDGAEAAAREHVRKARENLVRAEIAAIPGLTAS